METKTLFFALYLLADVGTDDPNPMTYVWALDGGFETRTECRARLKEVAPAYALMGPAARLECALDHAQAWH